MLRIDQTLFEEGHGNCLPACLAMMLDIALSDVPHFCVESGDWYELFAHWLHTHGRSPLSLSFDAKGLEEHLAWARGIGAATPWIASGTTSRGRHFVVYVGDKLFHDPNPYYGRTGLITIQDATFLIPAAC